MKSLTLSTLPLLWEYISGWEVSEHDTWPDKRPQPIEECRRCFRAFDARGLVPRTGISDRFLLTLPFCFCLDAEKPARNLRRLCFRPPPASLLFFVAFVPKRKKKTAKVKSPQSTSNRRSTPFLPVSFSFLTLPLFCLPFLSVACFPSVSFRCRSFYIQNIGLSLM